MMENLSDPSFIQSGQRHLHNIGTRPPFRRLKLSTSVFDIPALQSSHEIHELMVPDSISDIEQWVISLYPPKKFEGWDRFPADLKLPSHRLLVVPVSNEDDKQRKTTKLERLRSAVILSKCNKNFYLPDSPMIFTRNRLNRKIELIKLNIDQYYEVD